MGHHIRLRHGERPLTVPLSHSETDRVDVPQSGSMEPGARGYPPPPPGDVPVPSEHGADGYGPATVAWRDRRYVAWIASRWGVGLVIVITSFACVVPLYYVFSEALEDGASALSDIVNEPNFWDIVRTTAILTFGSMVFAVVAGTALAWWAYSLAPNRRWLGVLPMLPLVIPQLAMTIGFTFLFSPRIGYGNQLLRLTPFFGGDSGPMDVYTVPWMIIITGMAMASFVYLFVRSSLAQMAQDLVGAAAVSGAGPIRTFYRVVLPVLRPGITYGGLTVFVIGFGQFTVPLLLGTQSGIDVVTTRMYFHVEGRQMANAAAYGLPILLAGFAVLLTQRVMLRNQSRYVIAATRGAQGAVRRARIAQFGLAAYAFFTVALPLAALGVVSMQPFWSKDIDTGALTFRNFHSVLFEQEALIAATRNSLTFALLTVVLCLPVAFVTARAIHHRRRNPVLSQVAEIITSLPLGIPAVILGTGFLVAYTQGPIPLYNRPLGVVVMYSVIMLPFAVRFQLSAMMNLGEDLGSAASVSGAGPVRRFLLIEIPLLRPAIGAAIAIIFVLSTQEFTASVLIRGSSTEVMGTVIYDLFQFSSYPASAAMALITCAITGLGVVIALVIGGPGAFGGARPGRNAAKEVE